MKAASILIVEDEAVVALDLEKQPQLLGYTVVGLAFSGEAAIEMAHSRQPSLVLLDINLGSGMSGIEAARRINETRSVPVIFATAHSDDATLQEAKTTSPYGYVLKPIDEIELRVAIEIALYKHDLDMERSLLLEELKTALVNVKTLSGMIPICAWCHRIRDDRQYWNQLETYISERTDVLFSHGICPECKERHYPDSVPQNQSSGE